MRMLTELEVAPLFAPDAAEKKSFPPGLAGFSAGAIVADVCDTCD